MTVTLSTPPRLSSTIKKLLPRRPHYHASSLSPSPWRYSTPKKSAPPNIPVIHKIANQMPKPALFLSTDNAPELPSLLDHHTYDDFDEYIYIPVQLSNSSRSSSSSSSPRTIKLLPKKSRGPAGVGTNKAVVCCRAQRRLFTTAEECMD